MIEGCQRAFPETNGSLGSYTWVLNSQDPFSRVCLVRGSLGSLPRVADIPGAFWSELWQLSPDWLVRLRQRKESDPMPECAAGQPERCQNRISGPEKGPMRSDLRNETFVR